MLESKRGIYVGYCISFYYSVTSHREFSSLNQHPFISLQLCRSKVSAQKAVTEVLARSAISSEAQG